MGPSKHFKTEGNAKGGKEPHKADISEAFSSTKIFATRGAAKGRASAASPCSGGKCSPYANGNAAGYLMSTPASSPNPTFMGRAPNLVRAHGQALKPHGVRSKPRGNASSSLEIAERA